MTQLVPSTREFVRALRTLPKPGGRQLKFLRAHYRAPGRALTATRLATAAGYSNYGGINLHYGRLARDVSRALGERKAHLSILVDFVPPKSVTNRQWVLVMHPQFAAALERVGWV